MSSRVGWRALAAALGEQGGDQREGGSLAVRAAQRGLGGVVRCAVTVRLGVSRLAQTDRTSSAKLTTRLGCAVASDSAPLATACLRC